MLEPPRDSWRVRIQDLEGRIRGAGVLLTNYQVLTCAHVVAAALGAAGDEPPEGELRIDFTAHELVRGRWRAWVDPRGWISPDQGDLAILEIAGQRPPTVAPAQLQRCGSAGGPEVWLYRFDPEFADAIMKAERIGHEQGPNGTWINLDGEEFARYRHGFDGAGVIEKHTRNVIGCLISASAPGLQHPRMLQIEDAIDMLRRRGADLRLGQALPRLEPDVPVMQGRLTSTRWHEIKADLEFRLDNICAVIPVGDLELIVRRLKASFGPFFSAPYLSAATAQVGFQYVRSLLNACTEQTGATYALLDLLAEWFVRHGTSALDKADFAGLQQLVGQIDPDRGQFPEDLRRSLYDLIADVSFDTAAEAYEAADPVGSAAPAYASDPVTMARELERQNSRPGDLPSVVRFVEELAKRVARDVGDMLRDWVNSYGDLNPGLFPVIDECRYSPSPPKGRPVLMLEVDHDNPVTGKYKMAATLHHSEALSESRPVRPARGVSLYEPLDAQDLDTVIELTGELLSCIRQPPSARGPVVEFAVPQSMLGFDFDQWPVGAVLPRPLGTDRPVIVRMLGRSGSETRRRKWYWLLSRGHRVDPAAVHWLWQPSPPGALAQSLNGITPVCVAFAIPAKPQHATATDDFSVAIASGMPIVLWSRTGGARSDYRELTRMLGRHCLLDLPDQLRNWRASTANKPASWLGTHMTLMYDDPIRTTEAAPSDDGNAERGPE